MITWWDEQSRARQKQLIRFTILCVVLVVATAWLASCSQPDMVERAVPVSGEAPLPPLVDGRVQTLGVSGPVAWAEVQNTWAAEFRGAVTALQAQQAERAAARARLAQPSAAGLVAVPAPAPARTGACGGWEGLIRSHFGTDTPTACRVMMCESGGDPRSLNPDPVYQAAGLFQVIRQWAARYEQITGVPYYDGRFDPNANTMFAAYLVREEGWASQFDCY